MLQHLWSTPFLQDSFASEETVTRILSEYDINSPSSESGTENILDDFPDFRDNIVYPAFDKFLKLSTGKSISDWGDYTFKGWLTGSVGGYNINFHNHRGAHLSGVFYLFCEDNASGGEISFTDPRMNSNRGYDEPFYPWFSDLRIKPKNGDFVIFPSFLYHFVNTYDGNIRLAMPVDLYLHAYK